DAGDVLAELVIDLARPGHELEAERAVCSAPLDHGEATRGQGKLAAIGAGDIFPGLRLHMRQAGFCGELGAGDTEFTLPEGSEQIALQNDALPLTPGQTFVSEMFGSRIHRLTYFLAEAAHGERHGIALDQPMIEPGGSRCR